MTEHQGHVQALQDALIADGFPEGHVRSLLSLAALVTGTDVPEGFTKSQADIGYGKGATDMLVVRLALDAGMDAAEARLAVKGQLTRASAAMKLDRAASR
jgi:hypothetical protein